VTNDRALPVGTRPSPGVHAADPDPHLVICRLCWAILLGSLFIAIELAAGLAVNSLALLGDAWHNFADVLNPGIPWFAVRQIRRPADPVRTFGYHRVGILGALGNSVLLGVVVAGAGILWTRCVSAGSQSPAVRAVLDYSVAAG